MLNEDNPPLRVPRVNIAWVRRNLYFVPEPGRSYSLYVGSDLVASPRYELQNLISSDRAQLRPYASLSLLGLQPNPDYDPQLKASTRDAIEKAVFIGLVLIVTCVLAFWAFRLLKKMPAPAGE